MRKADIELEELSNSGKSIGRSLKSSYSSSRSTGRNSSHAGQNRYIRTNVSSSTDNSQGPNAHKELWHIFAVRFHGFWTGESNPDVSTRVVDNTVLALFLQFEPANLLPSREALAQLMDFQGSDGNQPELLRQILPIALACSCLTVFILPLYDGNTIHLLRWVMTILSAFMGPRLSSGFYPPFGVYILGMMVNKPLAVCTIGLGAWACYFLVLVMIKALGWKYHYN